MSVPVDDSIEAHLDALYPPKPKYWLYCHYKCGFWAQSHLKRVVISCKFCNHPGIKPITSFHTLEEAQRYAAFMKKKSDKDDAEVAFFIKHHEEEMKRAAQKPEPTNIYGYKFPDGTFYGKWLTWTCFPTENDIGFHRIHQMERPLTYAPYANEKIIGTPMKMEKVKKD